MISLCRILRKGNEMGDDYKIKGMSEEELLDLPASF